jgi:DNA-binding PadR family transcriptional regulator
MNSDEKLPLREASFFILLSLAQAPRHGYGIMRSVTELSEGRLQLSTGTLYGALRRMLDSGWIERYGEKSEVVNGRERKAYRITETGRKILNADIARMEELLSSARASLV